MNPSRDDIRRALVDSILEVAPEADFAQVRADRPLREQLDIDSYDFLTILVRLHDKLGVDVPESGYASMATLDGSVDYLAGLSARATVQPGQGPG